MSSAVFSPCRKYRYVLTRVWGGDEFAIRNLACPSAPNICAFIGLNPSTADETNDDPTIRRCIGYAKSWGFDCLTMLNLFAFRATDPNDMLRASDPVGPDNDRHIAEQSQAASIVVAAWGVNMRPARVTQVRALVPNLHYLRITKNWHPAHPLYLPKSLTPQLWSRA